MTDRETSKYRVVFAVLRFDHFLGDAAAAESKVKVKAIFATSEEAHVEAERLNALAEAVDEGGVTYRVQSTRLYELGSDGD